MGKILCATRGGEDSYRTQDAAITLAKERDDTLLFLYVVDLHFLDRTASSMVVDVEGEVAKMGEFLLLMAKERAAKEGVTAETLIREGEVREELKKAAHEAGVSLVVLGKPSGNESVFQVTGLEAFAADIKAEAGVEVRIV